MRLTIISCAVLATTSFALAAGPSLPASEKGFTRADADKNGLLELNEWMVPAEKRFLAYDANSDKAVTAEEIDARFKAQYERRREKLMQSLDANQDGTITEAELQAYFTLRFNAADLDKSGSLTLTEAQQARLALRKQMRQTYAKKAAAASATP